MNAQIEREGCLGCGLCWEICPQVFRLSQDNLAEAYGPVTEALLALAKEAEASCPVSIIRLTQ